MLADNAQDQTKRLAPFFEFPLSTPKRKRSLSRGQPVFRMLFGPVSGSRPGRADYARRRTSQTTLATTPVRRAKPPIVRPLRSPGERCGRESLPVAETAPDATERRNREAAPPRFQKRIAKLIPPSNSPLPLPRAAYPAAARSA